jgi:hypothetical protein
VEVIKTETGSYRLVDSTISALLASQDFFSFFTALFNFVSKTSRQKIHIGVTTSNLE